jgi:AcrR family transcriptional regulator
MFAERGFDPVTIADIARVADVAVQTVFNHFATKEELFFDGRTPWVDGPAEAVRSREPSTAPLAALRAYLVPLSGSLVGSLATQERRCYTATLQASETLRARERELVFDSERRLTEALLEAWTRPPGDRAPDAPADPRTAAPLIAGIWLTAARVLVQEKRALVTSGACPLALASEARDMAAGLFAQMETALDVIAGRASAQAPTPAPTPVPVDTGWPRPGPSLTARVAPARRAG